MTHSLAYQSNKKNKVKYAKMRRAASNPQLTQFFANNNHNKEPSTSTYSTLYTSEASKQQTNKRTKKRRANHALVSYQSLSFFFLFSSSTN
jgi:hypothetical protein